ncbi:MAG: right-handed parallel beta-helix repeat-containing protein [Alphaproteobacteria bacterium]|nr:right-handed parallel beta-helix repeat-containing protein [Alphaproteobacteria bacterium]
MDASAARVTAARSGALARSLADSQGDVIRVADLLGGRPEGRDATNAMVLALGLAANMPGSTIELCAGDWNFASLAASLVVPTRTTIRGAGRHQTRITWPDTGSFVLFVSASDGVTRCTDIAFTDLTVTGSWATNGNGSAYPFIVSFVDGLQFRNVCVEYSRIMSIVARNCTDVQVRECVVRYSGRDGINLAQCAALTIDGCTVEHCDDDGIAVHSDAFDPWVARKNLVISNNRVFDCQGIKVLSPRGAAIIGNVVDCCRSQGISLVCQAANNSEIEGVSAATTTLVTGNIITNTINRLHVDGLNQNAPGIAISGSSARVGILPVIPGEAHNATSAVVDPYPYFASNSQFTSLATPGSFGIIVADNFIGRTLPACNGTVTYPRTYAKFSDYGFGPMFTRNGWLDPSLAEADMRDTAVSISGGVVRDVLVSGNIIRGMTSGLTLGKAIRLENIIFRNNQVVDCANYGVLINTTGTLRAYIEENLFDLDPFLKHGNRGANGTWAVLGDPTGIKAQAGSGVFVRRNVFRNLCRDSDQASDSAGGAWLFEGNILEADPVTTGFSTANKGVGLVRTAGGTQLAQADSNPGSATFGKLLTVPSLAGTAMPASGKWLGGHFVRNALPAVSGGLLTLGWTRLTTGSSNVLGTDWSAAQALGGNVAGRLVLAGPASGSAAPSFRALGFADVAGVAPLPAITASYTASGAIAVTDNVALVNSIAAVSMTLGSGTTDGHPIVIKRYGVGTVTVTANIDGAAGSQVRMNASATKESVTLTWSNALATWLMV